MCYQCDCAEVEHGFSLAECPALLAYDLAVEAMNASIAAQDNLEARSTFCPPTYSQMLSFDHTAGDIPF